jgi:hypothetical protein
MGRIEVRCSFSKENTQTTVKGSYSGEITDIDAGNDKYDTDAAIQLNINVWDPVAEQWSKAKQEGEAISLGSQIKLEIVEEEPNYFETYRLVNSIK